MARLVVMIGVVFAVWSEAAAAQETDPLPPGAIARLGTARLRHSGWIKRCVFVQNGKAILSEGGDQLVRLWDAKTGRALRQFAGKSFYLSSDEKILVTGGNVVRVFDFATAKELPGSPILQRRSDLDPLHVGFTPDGKICVLTMYHANDEPAVGVLYKHVLTWDPKTGKLTHDWTIPDGDSYVFLSPDGQTIANGRNGNGITVRSAQTGELSRDWPLIFYSRTIFSPDSQIVVGQVHRENEDASKGGAFVGRDVKTGKDRFRIRTTSNLWAHFWSPDGKKLALGPGWQGSYSQVGPEKRSLLIIDAANGKTLHEIPVPRDGYEHVVFSADGKTLAVTHRFDVIRLWNLDTGKIIRDLPRRNYLADLSPDGKTVILTNGPCIDLYDVATGQRLLEQKAPERAPLAMVFSADGKTLVSIDEMSITQVWNLRSGRPIERLPSPLINDGALRPLFPFRDPHLLFASKGKIQAVGATPFVWGGDLQHNRVHHVDLAAGKLVRSYGREPPASIAVSNVANLVAATIDRQLHLWDLATGKEHRVFPWHDELTKQDMERFGPPRLPLLLFAPGGKLIATRSHRSVAADRQVDVVTLWEIATGKPRHRIERAYRPIAWQTAGREAVPLFEGYGGAMAIAPNGRWVALGHGDTIRLWDLESNREMRRFGATAACERIAFSPDSKLLAGLATETNIAGGDIDGRLQLWDVATGTALTPLQVPGRFTCFQFSPDGRTLATGCSDTGILIWDVAKIAAESNAEKQSLDVLWNDLASADAMKAGKAMVALRKNEASVAYFKKRLQPIAPADLKMLQKLLIDLDSGQFPVRERARTELERLGELALPAFRAANKLTIEGQRRVAVLREKLAGPVTDPATLRNLRAIEVLEQIGTPEAHGILDSLASGSPEHRVTEAARAASQRLKVRLHE